MKGVVCLGKLAILFPFLLGIGCGSASSGLQVGFKKVYKSRSGIRLVFIPAQEFTMGSNKGYKQDLQQVALSGYWIGETEVTNAQMGGAESNAPNNPVKSKTLREIETWLKAVSAKDGLAYSLPTEAQWECAARGGLRSKDYPWGDATYVARSRSQVDRASTTAVKSFLPNPFGLYDVTGNVSELVGEEYFERSATPGVVRNPQPRKGNDKDLYISRGGAYSLIYCPVSYREPCFANKREFLWDTGFRVVVQDNPSMSKSAFVERFEW